jgi:hypothetical protein
MQYEITQLTEIGCEDIQPITLINHCGYKFKKSGFSQTLRKDAEGWEIYKKRFETFEQMAQTLSLSSVGFDNKNAGQVARFYRSIYSREDEKKFGVVAFKMELV